MDNLDDLRCVAIIKMTGAVDEPARPVRPGAGDDLLRVLPKKSWLGAADDGEERAAQALGVGTAIVVIVATVFVDVRARGKDARRRADPHRYQFFAFPFGHQRFGFFNKLAKSSLAGDALRVELPRCGTGNDTGHVRALAGALVNDRLDRAEAVTDQNHPAIASLF